MLKGERNIANKEGFAVLLSGEHLGSDSLCYLGLTLALPDTYSLTATVAPSSGDYGKFLFSISQMPLGWGHKWTSGWWGPGCDFLGSNIVSKKTFEFGCLLVRHSFTLQFVTG